MPEIIDISKAKETLKPKEPKTTPEIIATIDNYIKQLDKTCFDAFSELPPELDEKLWDETQKGIYRYAVDQLAAVQILENFKQRLEK